MPRKRRPRRNAVPPYTPPAAPPETNPQLRAAILAIVDNQLHEGNPPATRATLERLVTAGYSPEGARQLIAHVVVREVWTMMAQGQVFDEARYVAALERLPTVGD